MRTADRMSAEPQQGPQIDMPSNDYYETLSVQPSSSSEEIARAYHRLARQYHPDLNPQDADAATRFKEISAAYQALSDPAQRAQYDVERTRAMQSHLNAEASPTTMETPQNEPESVFHHSVTLNAEGVESALDDLRANLADAANEVADELRGAMRDFARELDAIARTGGDISRYRSHRQGFPPPPPPHRGPAKPRRR